MVLNLDAVALFAVVGVSMVTSLALLVRFVAREFSEGRASG